MRKLIVSITVFLAIVSCSSRKDKLQIEQKIQSVETGLFDFAGQSKSKLLLIDEMSNKNVPGVSIAVINDNKIEWAKGYGILKAGTSSLVTKETVFEAASTTKIFTTVIMLDLVEKGLIKLDEDVNKYLRSWKIPENEFTQKKNVTLRLILSHQAGFNRPEGGFSFEEGKVPTLLEVIKGESPAKNQAATVEFVPGTKWQYSNISYIVLQLLIEDLTGKTFVQVANEIILNPLKLKSSAFLYPLTEELNKRKAETHDQQGNPQGHGLHPSAFSHAGLVTSPSDLAKFVIELMKIYQGKSDSLFSQKTAKLMFTKVVDLDPSVFGGISLGQGLGVFLRGEDKNLSFIMAGQNLPGTTSLIIGLPNHGKGAAIMTNGINGELIQLELIGAIGNVYNWPESKLF
jgi:CubicO group peptidase (beta-lactamase class C family)